MAGILWGLKDVALSLVMSLLTKEFLKSVALKFLRAEAEAYAARAAQTESLEDDARAKGLLGAIEAAEKAWN